MMHYILVALIVVVACFSNAIVYGTPAPSTYWLSLSADSSGQFVVGVSFTGVYVSSNFGVDWKLSLNCSSLSVVKSSASGQQVVMVSGMTTTDKCGPVLFSNDYGNTWISSSIPRGKLSTLKDVSIDGTGQHVATFSYATGNGQNDVFVSADGGNTFMEVNRTDIINLGSIAMAKSNGNVILGQSLGGLFYSTDYGATFQPNTKLLTDNWFGLSCCDTCSLVAASKGTDIAISIDSGLSWIPASTLPKASGYVVHVASSGKIIYAAAAHQSIFKSTNSGVTWTAIGPHSPLTSWTSIVSDASGQYVYASVSNGGIYRSVDFGTTWN